jgi:hypothetical protein
VEITGHHRCSWGLEHFRASDAAWSRPTRRSVCSVRSQGRSRPRLPTQPTQLIPGRLDSSGQTSLMPRLTAPNATLPSIGRAPALRAPDDGSQPRHETRVCQHRPVTPDSLPAYSDLILPAVKAVAELGGSAKAGEIKVQVLSDLGATDEMLAVMQPTRPDASVLLERIAWGRSYAKLIGALESPSRRVFLLTPLGKELLNLDPEEAHRRILEMDREYRRNREKVRKPELAQDAAADVASGPDDAPVEELEDGDGPRGWQEVLLERLHALSPDAR